MANSLNNLFVPVPPQPDSTPFEFDPIIVEDGKKGAFIIEIPRSGTLNSVEFLTGTLGNGTVRISFQGIGGSGTPQGIQSQRRDIAATSDTWTRPGLITSDGTDSGSKRNVSKGEVMGIVWEFPTFTGGNSIKINCLKSRESQAFANFPYTATHNGSAWSKSAKKIPILALQYSDKTYEYVYGTWPVKILTDVAFNQDSIPDERGLLFQVPTSLSIAGVWFFGIFTPGGSVDVRLYDSRNNLLTSKTVDTDFADTTTHLHQVLFPLSQTLIPDVNYRVALCPTSGVNVNLEQFSISTDANGTNSIMSAVPGGQTWCLTTRSDGGNWADSKTSRPWMGLSFDNMAAGPSVAESSMSSESTFTVNFFVTKIARSSMASLATTTTSVLMSRNLISTVSSVATVTAIARGGITSINTFILPVPVATTHANTIPLITSGSSSGLLDASGKKIAHVFQAPKTGVIDTVEFYCGPATLTGALKISFQDVSVANGNPDGVTDQYVNVSSLTANSWNTIGPLVNKAETWNSRTAAGTNQWTSITWSPELSLFAAVGTNSAMTSPDGVNWTARTAISSSWRAITWSPELSLFVAVATSGTNRVMTSPNGINWTARTAASNNVWQSVTWSPELNLFAAVSQDGANRVMTSPNGINWTERTASHQSDWRSVTWSAELGLFVAVGSILTGNPNRVMTSPDGTNWTGRPAPSANWKAVAWSPELGLFAAVADTGTQGVNGVMTSTDGINWTVRTTADFSEWYALTWSPEIGLFVAVARNTPPGTTYRVMTSTDGITWNGQTAAEANQWYGAAWSANLNLFAAVSHDGTNRVMTAEYKRSVTRGDVLSVVWEYQTFNSGNQVGVGYYEGSTSNLSNFPYRAHFNGSTWTKLNNPTEMALVYSDGSYAVPDGSFARNFADSITFNSGSNPNERGMRFQFPITVRASGCWLLIALAADADLVIYDANNNILTTVSLDKDLQFINGGDYHQVLFPNSQVFESDRVYRLAVKPGTTSNITFYESVFSSSDLRKASPPENFDWYSTSRLNIGGWTDVATRKPWMGFFIDGIEEN
jgi:hypothetical protein